MIAGVGVDIVSVARIERAMSRPRFVERVLAKSEREGFDLSPEFVAGRWAIKEAVAKCVGPPLRWHSVRILRGESGAPFCELDSGVVPDGFRVHISLSHEKDFAVGFAILERG